MSEIRMKMRYRVELSAPLVTQTTLTVLQQGDDNANVITASVYDHEEPAELSGYTVDGYMLKPDGERVMLDGTISGNTAEVALNAYCYQSAGAFMLIIRLKDTEGTKRTILRIAGYIESEGDGPILDPANKLPSWDDVVKHLEVMVEKADEAEEAAQKANEATQNIDEKTQMAEAAAQRAENAAEGAEETIAAAETAAANANSAAANATSAAGKANTAAANANSAAENAASAAGTANTAAEEAKEAAELAKNAGAYYTPIMNGSVLEEWRPTYDPNMAGIVVDLDLKGEPGMPGADGPAGPYYTPIMRGSVLEEWRPSTEDAPAIGVQIDLRGPEGKSPYIGENGNWYTWDAETGAYVDTGVAAGGGGSGDGDEGEGDDSTDLPEGGGGSSGEIVYPETNEPNMQLVTNTKGSMTWEKRTHYEYTLEVFAKEYADIDPEMGAFVFNSAVNIPPIGTVCKVQWNGETFEIVLKEQRDNGVDFPILGNLAAVGGEDTGEPFLIMITPENMMESMDGQSLAAAALDGSTALELAISAQAYERLPMEYLPDGYPYEKTEIAEILPETAFDGENGEYVTTEPLNGSIEIGRKYTVVYNGVEYECTAAAFDAEGVELPILGNTEYVNTGESGDGPPFVMMVLTPEMSAAMGGLTANLIALDDAEEAVASISGVTTVANKIAMKYLPDGYPYTTEADVDVVPRATYQKHETGFFPLPAKEGLDVGTEYRVIFQGEEYSCIAQRDTSYLFGGFVYLGDKTIGDSGGPFEYPFLYMQFDNVEVVQIVGTIYAMQPAETMDSAEFGIVKPKGTPIKIDPKYLPGDTSGIWIAGGTPGSVRGKRAPEEDENYTMGMDSFAYGDAAKAEGTNSHAFGNGWAIGNESAAEGWNVIAFGKAAHAEGEYGITQTAIISEIDGTSQFSYTADKGLHVGDVLMFTNDAGYQEFGEVTSVEDGVCTIEREYGYAVTEATAKVLYGVAYGARSHSEGLGTNATGTSAHAEGEYTRAAGEFSHAEGYYTIAAGNAQHVHGRYNVEDTESRYAHIVGNGNLTSGNEKRSNAHTLDWNGNAWFKGNVYVGGTDQDDGAEKLVTKSELEGAVAAAGIPVVTTGGNAGAYTASVPGITELTAGLCLLVRFHTYNTATATLDVNGLGAKSIMRMYSSGDVLTYLSGFRLTPSRPYLLIYNGEDKWILASCAQPDGKDIVGTVATAENAKSVTLTSPGGKQFALSVADDGTLSATEVTT